MSENAMKPCPFCGSKHDVYIKTAVNRGEFPLSFGRTYFYVRCVSCGAETKDECDFEEKKAVKRWNRRVAHD